MRALIVTPTYNERKNIGELIEKLFVIDSDYHLLVVDDNSQDDTPDKVRGFINEHNFLF